MDEQNHYQAIANEIDKIADIDKAFILWLLLGDYYKLSGANEIDPDRATTKEQFAAATMAKRQCDMAKEMRDTLYYAIW